VARWWRRGGSDLAPPSGNAGAVSGAPAPVQRAAWLDLAPLRPTVTAARPVASLDAFTGSLVTARNPSFLAPLGHAVDPGGPSGQVSGLAAPAAPQVISAGPELPVAPARSATSRSAVSRLVQRALDPRGWLSESASDNPSENASGEAPLPAAGAGAPTAARSTVQATADIAPAPRSLLAAPAIGGDSLLMSAPDPGVRANLPVVPSPTPSVSQPTVSQPTVSQPTVSPHAVDAAPVETAAPSPDAGSANPEGVRRDTGVVSESAAAQRDAMPEPMDPPIASPTAPLLGQGELVTRTDPAPIRGGDAGLDTGGSQPGSVRSTAGPSVQRSAAPAASSTFQGSTPARPPLELEGAAVLQRSELAPSLPAAPSPPAVFGQPGEPASRSATPSAPRSAMPRPAVRQPGLGLPLSINRPPEPEPSSRPVQRLVEPSPITTPTPAPTRAPVDKATSAESGSSNQPTVPGTAHEVPTLGAGPGIPPVTVFSGALDAPELGGAVAGTPEPGPPAGDLAVGRVTAGPGDHSTRTTTGPAVVSSTSAPVVSRSIATDPPAGAWSAVDPPLTVRSARHLGLGQPLPSGGPVQRIPDPSVAAPASRAPVAGMSDVVAALSSVDRPDAQDGAVAPTLGSAAPLTAGAPAGTGEPLGPADRSGRFSPAATVPMDPARPPATESRVAAPTIQRSIAADPQLPHGSAGPFAGSGPAPGRPGLPILPAVQRHPADPDAVTSTGPLLASAADATDIRAAGAPHLIAPLLGRPTPSSAPAASGWAPSSFSPLPSGSPAASGVRLTGSPPVQRDVAVATPTGFSRSAPPGAWSSAGSPAGAWSAGSPAPGDRMTVRSMSLEHMFAPGAAAVANGIAHADRAGSVVFDPPGADPGVRGYWHPSVPVQRLFGGAGDLLGGARDSIRSAAGGAVDSARGAAGNALGYASDAARGAAGAAVDSARGAFTSATETAQSAAGGAIDTARGALDDAPDAAGGAVGNAVSAARGAVGGAVDEAGHAASGAMNAVTGAVGGAAGPAGAGAEALPTNLDELARRLFDPLSARLKSELWLDRERAGMVTDLRR